MGKNKLKYCWRCGRPWQFIVGNYQQPSCKCLQGMNRERTVKMPSYDLDREFVDKFEEMKWSLYVEPFTGTVHVIGAKGEQILTDPSKEEFEVMIDFCYQFGYHKGKGFGPVTLTGGTVNLKHPIM